MAELGSAFSATGLQGVAAVVSPAVEESSHCMGVRAGVLHNGRQSRWWGVLCEGRRVAASLSAVPGTGVCRECAEGLY